MNKTLVALIASGALLSVAACSSTRTQRAPGEQVDDAALLTSVKSALVSNPVTEAGEINVDVNRGTVKLSGFVDTQDEKSKAGDVARGVDGVQTVQNDIAVKKENSSTGEVIDDTARREYEQRIRDLQAEIDEAEANHDHARADRAQLEFDDYGVVEAHCRLDSGPTTVVPLTLLPPVA